MHFTTSFTTIVIAFALGTDAVKIRKSRPLYGRQDKIAEPGDECFEPGTLFSRIMVSAMEERRKIQ